MNKNVLFLISLLLLTTRLVSAEDGEDVSGNSQLLPSNWSIDVLGAASIGHFTYRSDITPHAGLRFRYSHNPVISFYGTAGGGEFRSADNLSEGVSFTNRYLTYDAGVRLNILRMVTGSNTLTERAGIYTQTGFGGIISDVDTGESRERFPGQNYTGHSLLFHMGGGVTFRLGRRVDLFVQGVMNFTNSDLLDGYEREPGAGVNRFLTTGDAFVQTIAGITFKLGRNSRVRHTDWYRHDHRIDPLAQSLAASLQRLEIDMDLADTGINTLHDRIRMLERSLDDLSHLLATVHAGQLLAHDRQIESLQSRIQMLQMELDEISEKVTNLQNPRPDDGTYTLRYFIVAGVFENNGNAETLLRQVRAQGFGEAEIIRDRNRNYYLVTYSTHANEPDANTELDRIQSQVNSDAWIYIR